MRSVQWAGHIGLLLILGVRVSAGQPVPQHFYNVDKEVSIRGTVREVIMEPRHQGTAPFLMVILEEKTSGKQYRVEISPVWFFEQDLYQGESLNITGSLVAEGTVNLIMARQVRFRGEVMTVRDKHGFPNWSGGRGRQKGRRKR
jgi:hypothetical protein